MEKSGEVSAACSGTDMLNYELGDIIQEYRKQVLKLGSKKASQMTCSDLKEYISAASEPDYEVIDFVKFSREVIAKNQVEKTKDSGLV